MEKIEYLATERLRNDDHYQFFSDVVTLGEKYFSSATPVDQEFQEIKLEREEESKLMGIGKGSLLTKEVNSADRQRGKTWLAIRRKTEAFLLSPFSDEVRSAEVVRKIIRTYGDPRNLSFNEESSIDSRLTKDLLNDENVTHTKKLNLVDWVQELVQENNSFIDVLNERNEEITSRDKGKVLDVRQRLDSAYVIFAEKINATVVLNQASEGIRKFVSELNGKIKYYNNTLNRRHGGKQEEDQ